MAGNSKTSQRLVYTDLFTILDNPWFLRWFQLHCHWTLLWKQG